MAKRVALLMHGGVAHAGSAAYIPPLRDLVERLSRLFEVVVYTIVKPDGNSDAFECGRAQVKFVRARHTDPLPTKILRLYEAVSSDHHRKPYDLVHGFWAAPSGFAAVALGRALRIPSIVSILGGEAAHVSSIEYGNMARPILRRLTLWTCKSATEVVALTHYQARELARHGLQRIRTIVIPLGAAPQFYRSLSTGGPTPPYRFVHIGHLNPVKDQVTLLRTFQILRQHCACSLDIIGEDFLGGRLSEAAHSLGLDGSVAFRGYVPHESLPPRLKGATAMIHTSLYEGEGVSLAEGASAGLLLCGTRVGLLADLGDSAAVLAEPGDHAGLARKILIALSDPAMYRALRERSFDWAGTHTAEWTAERYAETYCRASSARGSSTPSRSGIRTGKFRILLKTS